MGRCEHEAAQSDHIAWLRFYEENWTTLRGSEVRVENLCFRGIPWPLFENVLGVGDITRERAEIVYWRSCPIRCASVSRITVEGWRNPSARKCCAGTRTNSKRERLAWLPNVITTSGRGWIKSIFLLEARSKFPSRGGVFRSINFIVVGSLSPAWRSAAEQFAEFRQRNSTTLVPSRARASRTGAPPISKMRRPVGALERKP
jgi:hypothetical protein